MILYRFARQIYSNDISGAGAKKLGGRWNSPGLSAVYTSSAISLSLLEILVYHSAYEEISTNMLMRIEVPDTSPLTVTDRSLKQNWQNDIDYSRFIGNEFLKSKELLLLKVPSAIIPEEYNIVINPAHPDFKKVKILKASLFQFDARLFK